MALKALLESLDDVEDALHALYVKQTVKDKDGKNAREMFVLNIEGIDLHPNVTALKNAHERQKADNVALKEKVTELEGKAGVVPEGFTVEEWDRLKAVDEQVKKGDDPEKKKVHEAEVQSIKTMHEQKVTNLINANKTALAAKDEEIAKHKSTIERLVVKDGLTKALAENGLQGTFLKAAAAMLAPSVKMQQDGDSDPIAVVTTDLDDVPVGDFIKQWVQSDDGKAFLPAPQGGGAPGSDPKNKNTGPNPFSKAGWNMTQQGQLMRDDVAKAERLAKAAGHASAASAKKENAK